MKLLTWAAFREFSFFALGLAKKSTGRSMLALYCFHHT